MGKATKETVQRLKAERSQRKSRGTEAGRESGGWGIDTQETGKTRETNRYQRRGPPGSNRRLRSVGRTARNQKGPESDREGRRMSYLQRAMEITENSAGHSERRTGTKEKENTGFGATAGPCFQLY